MKYLLLWSDHQSPIHIKQQCKNNLHVKAKVKTIYYMTHSLAKSIYSSGQPIPLDIQNIQTQVK